MKIVAHPVLARLLTSKLRLQAMSSVSFLTGPMGRKRLIRCVSLEAVGGSLPLSLWSAARC
jgi:hypothetical protein